MENNTRLLTAQDLRDLSGKPNIEPLNGRYDISFEDTMSAQDKKTLKAVGEWLMKHCKGYHRGNHGGEFGHFGIFRTEIEALKRGEFPE